MDKDFSIKIGAQLADLMADVMLEAQSDKRKMVAVMERLVHNLTMTMVLASGGNPKVYDDLAIRIGSIIDISGKGQIETFEKLSAEHGQRKA